MDALAATFYAVVCGALAAAAPSVKSFAGRIALGVAIGIAASATLPALRRLFIG